jgi:hypothetical protein
LSGGNLLDRYLSPILGPLAIIGAIGFSSFRSKYLRYILIAGCILQFASASVFTYVHRIIPSGTKQGYAFIRNNTPTDAKIMCTKNALALHAERVAMWSTYASLAELPYLFWDADEEEALQILEKYGIEYIFVEKDRIYDDREVNHLGGYPQSFLTKQSTWPSFELVFDNESIGIWKITQSPS